MKLSELETLVRRIREVSGPEDIDVRFWMNAYHVSKTDGACTDLQICKRYENYTNDDLVDRGVVRKDGIDIQIEISPIQSDS